MQIAKRPAAPPDAWTDEPPYGSWWPEEDLAAEILAHLSDKVNAIAQAVKTLEKPSSSCLDSYRVQPNLGFGALTSEGKYGLPWQVGDTCVW